MCVHYIGKFYPVNPKNAKYDIIFAFFYFFSFLYYSGKNDKLGTSKNSKRINKLESLASRRRAENQPRQGRKNTSRG